MAAKGLQGFMRGLNALRTSIINSKDPLTQCLSPRLSRLMATETTLPGSLDHSTDIFQKFAAQKLDPSPSTVQTTIYAFPSMEPLQFENYSAKHLHMPLRRDLLHRAVIFEGDMTRQGTANTKTRWEIHGSHRKIRPQKGTGKARLGTRQSPMLKGGAKVFGPRPRNFATGLPKKIYDIAWRTALSYRYRKGELIICEKFDVGHMEQNRDYKSDFLNAIFVHNHWVKENGRTLMVSLEENKYISEALEQEGSEGRILTYEQVDVKDLLEGTERIVIEKAALNRILEEHQSDLAPKLKHVV
ncbi:50S ribosomal protein-like protein L4 [Bisporella sp. PMI_857]|nr:50S ribosomal protein-like protein L4 [Bisporella sp. PMI_857]KAH8600258.1 50S ribosomal protein-like protein L4 [Bisporella sp. PMI_857]